MSALALNAEALYSELLRGVRTMCTPETRLVGITSGGAWLAERLQKDLGLSGKHGSISSAMHRDDFAQRGLSSGGQTQLPFEIQAADVLILDDVLYTGNSLLRVIEWLNAKSPSAIYTAVLADRHVSQLPVRADVVGVHLQVAPPDVVECHVPPYEALFQIEILRLDHAV